MSQPTLTMTTGAGDAGPEMVLPLSENLIESTVDSPAVKKKRLDKEASAQATSTAVADKRAQLQAMRARVQNSVRVDLQEALVNEIKSAKEYIQGVGMQDEKVVSAFDRLSAFMAEAKDGNITPFASSTDMTKRTNVSHLSIMQVAACICGNVSLDVSDCPPVLSNYVIKLLCRQHMFTAQNKQHVFFYDKPNTFLRSFDTMFKSS